MKKHMKNRPRRSVLYVPANNAKALSKLDSIACDAVILDLEDAVGPDDKTQAREAMRNFLSSSRPKGKEIVVRINALSSEWGTEDLLAARAVEPDGILLPKVDGPRDILEADEALEQTDAVQKLKLWAMVETPKSLLNLGPIAQLGRDPAARLSCLIAGTNDIVKDTGIRPGPERRNLAPFLLQMVMAARAGGLDMLDGVYNDFRDADGFAAECAAARDMGFDGKTLIHPSQVEPANAAFSPTAGEVAEARAIVAAFALEKNKGKGVIKLDGRMVERLHFVQAERTLARAAVSRD
jgi:citrate lyase subunit beta/citryl-CoA lyase